MIGYAGRDGGGGGGGRGVGRGGGRIIDSNATSLDNIAAAIAPAQEVTDLRDGPSGSPACAQKKRRWSGFWRLYGCFGFQKHQKRIGDAVLPPHTAESVSDGLVTHNFVLPTAISLPFVAPPSSPASFVASEPYSAAQSPAGSLSLTSIYASMYSPPGPHSMFAIGPYAHETQLVSPPVFSAFTTEPSTAAVTPTAESINMTTPASPEVPFAQFLDLNQQCTEAGHGFPLYQYEFKPYQLSPGSPVGHLISPSSGISGSGTSSPFPGREIAAGLSPLHFRVDQASNAFHMDILGLRDWRLRHNSGSLNPDSMRPSPRSGIFPVAEWENNGGAANGATALFELPAEEVREGEISHSAVAEPGLTSSENYADVESSSQPSITRNTASNDGLDVSTTYPEMEKMPSDLEERKRHQRRRSITLGSSRDFTFDEGDRKDAHRPGDIASGWTGETVIEEEHLSKKNWSFPVMQPSIS